MKAIMVRKASSLNDWKAAVKEYNLRESEIVIEKTIELSENEFNELCNDFFANRSYITNNLNHMYMQDGVWHCMLVKSPSSKFGILIESEGYDYARYTGVVNISEVRNG
jgi:hypothetical protein